MTGANTAKAAADLFTQAVDSFESALKTGVKLQEDSLKWWSDLASESTEVSDWQKRAHSMFEELIPTAQKTAEESLKTFDQISRSSLDILKKAFSTSPGESGKDLQERIQKLWEETLTALRRNTEAILETHSRALKTWTDAVQKKGSEKTTSPE